MGIDAASVRVLITLMGAFVEDVLGLDPKTKKSKPNGGLLGEVCAYFDIVETQGRGTLDDHCVFIRFSACPPNSKRFNEEVARDGDAFIDGIVKYAGVL